MRTIGTPSTQVRKLNAIASGTLPSGDPVVVNADGTVSIISGEAEGAGTPVIFYSSSMLNPVSTFDSNSNKVVVVYSNNNGTAVVGTVSGTSISFGSPVVFSASGLGSMAYPAVTFDSNSNKVVIAYNTSTQCRAIVGTVSGTSISFGSATAYDTSTGPWTGMAFDSNSNKVVISYARAANSYYGTAIIGTVSGTSISFGTKVVFESARVDNTSSTFDSNSNKIVIAYKDRGNSYAATAIVGTVSGTSISFGGAAVMLLDNANPEITFDSYNNKIVAVYARAINSTGYAIVGTVSGTSISFGSAVVFNSSVSAAAYDLWITFDSSNNKVVITYQNDTLTQGTVVVGTVSGASISFGSDAAFSSDSTEYITSTFDSNSNKVVIAYQDEGNGSVGAAAIFTVGSTNLTSENYVGIASNGYNDNKAATIDVQGAINDRQSGLTAGQSYYVQADGTLTTTAGSPSVFAGTAVSATKMIVKG